MSKDSVFVSFPLLQQNTRENGLKGRGLSWLVVSEAPDHDCLALPVALQPVAGEVAHSGGSLR